MRKKMKLGALLLSALTFFSMASCGKKDSDATFEPIVALAQTSGDVAYQPTIAGSPSEKVEIPLLAGDIYDVCKNYQLYITKDYNQDKKDAYAPTSLTISWTCDETPKYYTLELATKEDMSDAASYVTFDNQVELKYLFMGYDYYYQICANYDNKIVKSRIFEFSTEHLARTVYVDAQVTNTRDFGGYYTEDGNRVKQGIAYRGAKVDQITEEGKRIMLEELGIKTDLDIRGDGEYTGKGSPLGESVNYISLAAPWYAYGDGNGINGDKLREGLLGEIRAFANKDNYPIYVHCSVGRDRTGTICFLINGLLGVSETDLDLDYELSFMSRNRGDRDVREFIGTSYLNIKNYLKSTYKQLSTWKERIEQFMLDIGITESEIAAIRANMLEA